MRAGARVRAGDVLATLDDQRLRLERQRWESQRDELTNEYHQALGALDRGATRVLQAQVAQAEARLALVEGELQRTRIIAPFDGLVVSVISASPSAAPSRAAIPCSASRRWMATA